MKTYTIKINDDRLWQRVKSKAADQGISIKKLIETLLRSWLDEK